MLKSFSVRILIAILALVLASLACSPGVSAEPTEIPATNTPQPLPTNTAEPTFTPKPTATPNIIATEVSKRKAELSGLIREYYNAGYLPSVEGEFFVLPDFDEDWAQIKYYRWWRMDLSASTFVMSGHLSWSSAIEYPDISGCGFAFGASEIEAFAVFVDKDRILFVNANGDEVGKTRGSGRVSFSLPAEADFTLIVNAEADKAYALVNGEFIGEYPLNQDKIISGQIGYSILSGTNKDFGTHCEITNAGLWIIE